MEILQRIEEYLNREIELPSRGRISPEEDLLKQGLLDSLVVLRVVRFIEDEFDVRVEEPEVSVENFRDLASMSDFVESKVRAGSGTG